MALDSYTDILAHILERGYEESTDSSGDFSTLAADAIVEAWRDISMRWPILEWRKDPPGAFVTTDDITTTTITVSAGEGVTATLSAGPSASISGRKIAATGSNTYSRVTSHTAGATTCVLDAVQTALTAAACVIYQDEYTLASDLGLFVDGLWFENGNFVPIKPESVILEAFTPPVGDNYPSAFARIGRRKILLSHYPTAVKRVEYSYSFFPDDPSGSSELALPKHWRPALAELALALLLGMKFDRREADTRARAEHLIENCIRFERQRVSGLQGIVPTRYVGSYGS